MKRNFLCKSMSNEPKAERTKFLRLVPSTVALVIVGCGGSVPEASSPSSSQPEPVVEQAPSAPPPSAPADGEYDSEADEGLESGEPPTLDDESSSKDETEAKSRPNASGTAGSAQYDVPKALAELERYDTKLSEIIELGAPDCNRAETFRRAVCQLAERICALEGQLPSTVKERHCSDSRERCLNATARYKKSCAP